MEEENHPNLGVNGQTKPFLLRYLSNNSFSFSMIVVGGVIAIVSSLLIIHLTDATNYLVQGLIFVGISLLVFLPLVHFLLLYNEKQRRIREKMPFLEAEIPLKSIFSSDAFMLAHLDHNLKFLWVNGAFASEFDQSPQEIIGKHYSDLIIDDEIALQFDRVVRVGESIDLRDKLIVPKGSHSQEKLFWDLVAIPAKDHHNSEYGVFMSAVNVTQRVQTEKALDLERRRTHQILDTVREGVYIVNKDHEVEYANPVVRKEFGMVDGQKCYRYLHGSDQPCLNCFIDSIKEGEVVTSLRTSEVNGRVYDSMDMPITNPDGSVSKLRVMHDITQLKRDEEKLKNLNLKLQRLAQKEHDHRVLVESLVEAAAELNKSLNLDDVLARILEQMRKAIPFDWAETALIKEGSIDRDSYQRCLGDDGIDFDTKSPFPFDSLGLFNELLQTKKPILVQDVRNEAKWEDIAGWEWCRSFISVPLIIGDEVIGYINLLDRTPNLFTDFIGDELVAFGAHAAVAIQNAWFFEKVQQGNERMKNLSRHQVEMLENERLYISRELHDEAGQVLTSLLLDVDSLKKNADSYDFVIQKASQVEHALTEVVDDLHRIAMSLRPASLDHLGLIPAIRQHVETITKNHDLIIDIKETGFEGRLPEKLETVIYRIVQEALTNVVRHAQATRVDLLLTIRENKLIVIIEDDGVGFDTDQAISPNHLGIFGIQERVNMLNGHLDIESVIGKGTTVRIEVEYDNPINDR